MFIGESSIANSKRSTFISVVSTLMLVWYSFHGVKWHMGCLKMVPHWNHRHLRGGPLLVVNGVIAEKWSYKWVTEVITLLIGFITPFVAGWGPPCNYLYVASI